MESIIELVVPFIVLSILSVMSDVLTRWLEAVMRAIPGVPDKFEWWIAYVVIFGVGYFVCWQLDYGLFTYFGLHAKYPPLDYILTALIVSGGSSFVRNNYGVINEIPSILSGVSSVFRNPFNKNGGK